jgi:hypothetical protein
MQHRGEAKSDMNQAGGPPASLSNVYLSCAYSITAHLYAHHLSSPPVALPVLHQLQKMPAAHTTIAVDSCKDSIKA